MFSDLVQSINSWKQNTLREDKVTQTSDILFRELSDQIRELKDREVKKAQDELLGKKNPTNDNNDPLEPPQDPNNPQPQIIQQPKPRRQNLRGGRTRIIPASGGTGGGTSNMVVPTKKEVPHKIQTYRRGKGGGTDHSKDKGKVTTINLTKPAIDLASKKTPDSPPTQPTQSSSPSIVISPIDMSNSYNLEFFSMYEIV